MRKLPLLLLAASVAMGSPSMAAQQPTPALQALDDALPGDLINDPTSLEWNIYGPGVKRKTIKNAAIPGGGVALQITSPTAGLKPYEIAAEAPVEQAIPKGTHITVAFYARTIKAETVGNQGLVSIRMQQKVSPWPGFGDRQLIIGNEWKLYDINATADIAIQKGDSVVVFQLGGAKQVIEIGQTYVLDMSSTKRSSQP